MNILSRSRFSERFILACALAVPLVSSVSRGQTVPDTDVVYPLAPVTVTARRVAEDASDVPAYTQVILRDQIDASGALNLIDLLSDEANLQFTSLSGSPTNTKVSLRGTGTGGNGRTLILLDGIRTNRADMGDFNWLQFSLENIESIEIIQGPQGAFYGDNAVGGVIKIHTLGEPAKSGGSAQVLVGSDGTVKVAGGYIEKVGNAWAGVSGGYDRSDGYRDHSGYSDEHAALNFGYDNQKTSVTRVNVSFLHNVYDQPGYLTQAQYEADPTQQGTSISNGWSDYQRVSVSNEYGFSPQAKLLTDGGVNFVREYYNGFADQPYNTKFNRGTSGYFLSPKLHLETGDFTFTPGVDFNCDTLWVNTTGPAQANVSREVVSPYLAAEWRFAEKFTLSGAFRREWNSLNAQEQVPSSLKSTRSDAGNAGQIALNYKPTKTLHFYAKYDRAYRFPATDEIAYYQGPLGGVPFGSGTVFLNPGLKPELSDNYEVGGGFNDKGWSAGASVYYLKTTNEIFFNNATGLNENLAETRRVGAQVNAGYDAKIAGFRSRVDYVDADLIDGGGALSTGPLRMTPSLRVTNMVFVRPAEGWELSVTQQYIGSCYEDESYSSTSPTRLAGVMLFDTKISYKPTANWRIFAGVNNVFDKSFIAYDTYGSIYPGQGRFIYAGSSVGF